MEPNIGEHPNNLCEEQGAEILGWTTPEGEERTPEIAPPPLPPDITIKGETPPPLPERTRERNKNPEVALTENFIFGDTPANFFKNPDNRWKIEAALAKVLKYLPLAQEIDFIETHIRNQKKTSGGKPTELESLMKTRKELLEGELAGYHRLIDFVSQHHDLTEIMRQTKEAPQNQKTDSDPSGMTKLQEGVAIRTKRDKFPVGQTQKPENHTAMITLKNLKDTLTQNPSPELIKTVLAHVKIYTETFTQLNAKIGGLEPIDPNDTSERMRAQALKNIGLIKQFGEIMNSAKELSDIRLSDEDDTETKN